MRGDRSWSSFLRSTGASSLDPTLELWTEDESPGLKGDVCINCGRLVANTLLFTIYNVDDHGTPPLVVYFCSGRCRGGYERKIQSIKAMDALKVGSVYHSPADEPRR